MAKIFKPRRGLKSTMAGASKKTTVLAAGEMFVEFDSAVGGKARLKFGDGTTQYSNLPYSIETTDTGSSAITVTADSSSTSTAALNNVASNKTVSAIVGSLKQAITKTKSELNTTIDGKAPFSLFISSGTYGYKKTDGTFVAFKSQADIDAAVAAAKVGNAVAADVLKDKTFTNVTTSGVVGTMPNNGAVTKTLSAGTLSYTIVKGYHNGSGKVSVAKSNTYKSTDTSTNINASGWAATLNCGQSVTIGAGAIYAGSVTANSLKSQTGVDSGKSAVTAGTMVSGYQGWVNGNKITGTFAAQTKTATPTTTSRDITPDSGKYLTKVTVEAINVQTKTGTPSTTSQDITPDSGKYLTKVTVEAITPQRGGSAIAAGNGTCWTYADRLYCGIDYGWYPAGSYGGMSNISERYIPFANIANAVGVNANTVRAGQTILGVTGANHSGTFTFPVGSNGTTADMGTANTYRWVNATNVYNQGVSDADGRANTSSVNYQSGYNTGYNTGYESGYSSGYGQGKIDGSTYTIPYLWARADGDNRMCEAEYVFDVSKGSYFKISEATSNYGLADFYIEKDNVRIGGTELINTQIDVQSASRIKVFAIGNVGSSFTTVTLTNITVS